MSHARARTARNLNTRKQIVRYAEEEDTDYKFMTSKKKYIYVEYCTNSKAYRLFDPDKKSIIVSRDVQFDEEEECDTSSSKISSNWM